MRGRAKPRARGASARVRCAPMRGLKHRGAGGPFAKVHNTLWGRDAPRAGATRLPPAVGAGAHKLSLRARVLSVHARAHSAAARDLSVIANGHSGRAQVHSALPRASAADAHALPVPARAPSSSAQERSDRTHPLSAPVHAHSALVNAHSAGARDHYRAPSGLRKSCGAGYRRSGPRLPSG